MALVSPSLVLFGLLAPALPASRVGPEARGHPCFANGPCLRACLNPGQPAPKPARQRRQGPRACLDNETSSHGPESQDVAAPGVEVLTAPTGRAWPRPGEDGDCLSPHVPLIYALCTLQI